MISQILRPIDYTLNVKNQLGYDPETQEYIIQDTVHPARHKLVGFENPHMHDFENPNTSERAREAIDRYEEEWEASQ
eukprot:SAG11_NODE_1900_length_4091_cov_2.418838_4_plen_77_part_00